jgi:hypothetical protein
MPECRLTTDVYSPQSTILAATEFENRARSRFSLKNWRQFHIRVWDNQFRLAPIIGTTDAPSKGITILPVALKLRFPGSIKVMRGPEMRLLRKRIGAWGSRNIHRRELRKKRECKLTGGW